MKEASKKHSSRPYWIGAIAFACLMATTLIVVACSSGSGATPGGMAHVKVSLSDPATCAAPDGPFAHVFVTITDVQANVSSSAGDNDSGWVDLTPNLSKAPQQIDLLGQANNQCFLASLGDNEELQAGNYQQIRVILADNSASVTSNQCGSAANCVVLTSDSSVHELQLSSESKTGLKIPSGQIAGGGFNIAAGQTKDLNIDFNTCASIVQQGNGQFRLKPVLHAGEVGTTSSSINGKVIDQSTGSAVVGAVTVNLEQPDATGVDRVVMSATAAADGTFVFCPLPAGTYDVVVVGTRSDGVLYAPTIVTGVLTGSTTGNLNLYLPGSPTVPGSAATFSGVVTSANASNAATIADVQLSSLEMVGTVNYTIPLPPTSTQTASSLTVETAPSSGSLTCPSNTDCAAYTLTVPVAGAYSGAWSASGATLTQSAPQGTYTIDGLAFVPGSGGSVNCTPSEITSAVTPLTGAGPFTISISDMSFVSCQ